MSSTDRIQAIAPEPSLTGTAPMETGLFDSNEGSQFVRAFLDGPEATLSSAAVAIARVEREVDELWSHALSGERRGVSERLVEVSHALRRASRLLEGHPEIG